MALTRVHNRLIEGAAVNVKDFGAVGDGVTDDTAAIQAALDYAGSASSSSESLGASVYCPEGTYLTGSLTIPGRIRIYGDGPYVTVFKLKAATNASHFNLTSTTNYFNVLENFSMEGNKVNQTGGTSHGINFYRPTSGGITGSGNNRVVNVWVKNYQNHGVVTGGVCNGTTLERVYSNFNDEFGFDNFAGDIVFSNCQAFSNTLTGFNENGVGTQYSNCKAWLNGSNNNPTGSNRFAGFRFRAAGLSNGARNIVVTGCFAQENYGHGFHFDGDASTNISGVTLSGCLADGNGITQIQGVSTNRIYDGYHLAYAKDCVIQGSAGQFYIESNATWKTQRYALYLDANSSGNIIDLGVIQHDAQTRGGSTGEYFISSSNTMNNIVNINGDKLIGSDIVSTVAGASVSNEQNFGVTLLDGSSAFTQVILGGSAPTAGTVKTFVTIDATNVCQIQVTDYINGSTLQIAMNSVGDTVKLISTGYSWALLYTNVTIRQTTAYTSQFESLTDPVNTSNKYAGKMMLNLTTNTIVAAVGGATSDVWVAAGSTAHTPV